MGTLSVQAAKEGIDTYLVSMDSDIAQLVRPGVNLWMYRPYQRDYVIFKSDERRRSSATASCRSRCPTSRRSRATPPTTSPASPASATRPPIKLVTQFGTVESMLERRRRGRAAEAPGRRPRRTPTSSARASTSRRSSATPPSRSTSKPPTSTRTTTASAVLEFFRELEFRTLMSRLPEADGLLGDASPQAPPAARREARLDRRQRGRRSTRSSNRIAEQKSLRPRHRDDDARADARRPRRPVDRARRRRGVLHPGRPRAAPRRQRPAAASTPCSRSSRPCIEDPDIAEDRPLPQVRPSSSSPATASSRRASPSTRCSPRTSSARAAAPAGQRKARSRLGWLGARRLGIELQDRDALLEPDATSASAHDHLRPGRHRRRSAMRGRLRRRHRPPARSPRARARREGHAPPLRRDRDAAGLRARAHGAERRRHRHRRAARDVRIADDGDPPHRAGDLRLRRPRVQHRLAASSSRRSSSRSCSCRRRADKTGAYSTDAQSLEGLRGLHDIVEHIYSSTAS